MPSSRKWSATMRCARQALDEALAFDLEIEGNGSIDKQRFMDVARR